MLERKRNIAFIHDVFPAGGGERVTIDIANYLSEQGYNIYIFTTLLSSNLYTEDQLKNCIVIVLPERYIETSEIDADEMISNINSLNISIVISVGRKLDYLSKIQSNTICKFVYALHSIPFWEKEYIIDRARKRRQKSFFAKLEWLTISYPKHMLFKKALRKTQKSYREIYNNVDAFTVLCDEYKKDLLKGLNISSNNDKVTVIPNSEHNRANVSLNKQKNVLYVGRLSYLDKRLDRLIDAWSIIYKQVSDWNLIIVGDGDMRQELENQVKENHINNIHFVGATHNVQHYYDDASILCLTSTFEGWPLCLTEAQANGVVPIAFDCSAGVHHILAPSGTNGFLIPCFDIQKYADTLLHLMNDESLLAEMQQQVLTKSKEYASEIVGEKWKNLFDKLLQ